MQIIVVSDTHRNTTFIEKLTSKYPDAKYYLHAGDSELQEMELYPFETVKGNCDYYIKNKIKVLNANGINILMLHGDHFLLTEDMLITYAQNYDAHIIIHGHTHIPYYQYTRGIHIICPGSIAYPRVTRATYVVIEINNYGDYSSKNVKVVIKNYE